MGRTRKHRKEYEVTIQLPGRGIVGTRRIVFDPEHLPFRSDFHVTKHARKFSGGKDWYQVWKNPSLMKDPATMWASEINRELDRLDIKMSGLTTRLIQEGYGHVRWNDIPKIGNETSREAILVNNRQVALRQEIAMRYGPGAPSRLPTHERGRFDPRRKRG